MPPQATNDERLEKKIKGFELTREVRDRLTREPHGNQRLIVENLLRMYYGFDTIDMDEITDSNFDK